MNFSFNNSLEGLKEHTKSYYTQSYGLLQGKDTD